MTPLYIKDREAVFLSRLFPKAGGFFVRDEKIIDIGNGYLIFTSAFIKQSTRVTSGYLLNKIAFYSAQGSSLKPGE